MFEKGNEELSKTYEDLMRYLNKKELTENEELAELAEKLGWAIEFTVQTGEYADENARDAWNGYSTICDDIEKIKESEEIGTVKNYIENTLEKHLDDLEEAITKSLVE